MVMVPHVLLPLEAKPILGVYELYDWAVTLITFLVMVMLPHD